MYKNSESKVEREKFDMSTADAAAGTKNATEILNAVASYKGVALS